jgi:cystathionine gamma-synthase
MATIAAALSLVPDHGVIVAPTAPYNLTSALLREYADRGHEVRSVDITNTNNVIEALDGAALVWVESPTNPLLDVADLPHIFAEAHRHDVLSVCDNTLATPLLQKPIQLGTDLVVHSVTKYLAGHSDVLLGAAVTPEGTGLRERLHAYRTLHGAIAGPMETWLALRGLRTLHVRFERQCANAVEIAARLERHTAVERVRYPGFGAMISIEVRGGAPAADVVADACRLWVHATSLGGVESLLERRRRYAAESPAVPENLLRLSVGIEDVDDLWRDVSQALDTATGSPR